MTNFFHVGVFALAITFYNHSYNDTPMCLPLLFRCQHDNIMC